MKGTPVEEFLDPEPPRTPLDRVVSGVRQARQVVPIVAPFATFLSIRGRTACSPLSLSPSPECLDLAPYYTASTSRLAAVTSGRLAGDYRRRRRS